MPVSKSPKQPTLDGERLRRDIGDARRDSTRAVEGLITHGFVALWADQAVVPDGWHRCNGGTVLRSRYPRLAAALAGAVDDAEVTLPAAVAPAGFDYWIWGPPG